VRRAVVDRNRLDAELVDKKRPYARKVRAARIAGKRGHRVLIVEDNKLNQLVARKLIEREGYVAAIVENGQEALEAIETGEFALVLMDVHMPVMDGITATRLIRGMPGAKAQLPIIAITADVLECARDRLLGVGMDDYIPKPVDPRLFRIVVRRWIGGASIHAPSRTEMPADDPIFVDLRKQYRGRLLDDAARLDSLWSVFSKSDDPTCRTRLAEAMMRLAHSLAGSAANFGFAAIGAAATPLDGSLSLAIGNPAALSATPEWAELIARLIALCRATSAGNGNIETARLAGHSRRKRSAKRVPQ